MKMKVGETLVLEQINDHAQIVRYRCKLAEIKDNALLIGYPIEEKTGKTPVLLNGTAYMAIYISDNQVFRFPTTFIQRISGQVPLMLMSFDGEDSMEGIQRRNYVRVEASLDIAIHSSEGAFRPFATMTSDIGGGGSLINLPNDTGIEEEDQIVSWIALPMTSGSYQYIKVQSRVIKIFNDKHTNGKRAAIKFLLQSERERQPIIRYCFEKQLEARKKLLELESHRHKG
ncbi:flagellar brake domain-containing protein [Sporolactobacillus shoreicorticis]|uniref:Flagellar brake protein n=1 Tax=Sporolactobacillus shoreicorticis TaxID=1923877 RepID=A0ABW5S0Z7_9BACL|nr:flagellar brake domain-containing protein [Sporolactobacillus shoreicorticis]MCO7127048.1 flagellar brake domain-containing protein [Sporolactobacillus shoreicorticis]